MDRVSIVDRKGNNCSFVGSPHYSLKVNWAFGVTVYAEGIPVGFFWRPLSVSIGRLHVVNQKFGQPAVGHVTLTRAEFEQFKSFYERAERCRKPSR